MKVALGDVVFPLAPRRELPFSNPRRVAVIAIPGAPPVYQDMGEEETVISWEGALIGDDAYKTAIRIESMKDAGKPVQLFISEYPELCKQVIIRNFPWKLVRHGLVEYSIELLAVMPPPKVAPPVQEQTGGIGSGAQTNGAKSQGSSKEYIVKPGDTLWAIAQRYLGSGPRWREIAEANNIVDPRKLRVGQRLVIPT